MNDEDDYPKAAWCTLINYTLRDEDAIIVFEGIEDELIRAYRTTRKMAERLMAKYPVGEQAFVTDFFDEGISAEVGMGYETIGLPFAAGDDTDAWLLDKNDARKQLPPEVKL